MTDLPDLPDVHEELLARMPEHRVVPTLARVQRVMELLGDPQQGPRVVQVTGTNGKTSTARMIETLLQATGLRVGTYTSPHLESVAERIRIDGAPLDPQRFVEVYEDIRPILALVDSEQEVQGEQPLTYFEALVCLAYAAFADAPVDVAVVEVGMGGTWDATNVVTCDVAVFTPVAVDHAEYLGTTPEQIAAEKAGIISDGAIAVIGPQTPGVLDVLLGACARAGAQPRVFGRDFDLVSRTVAVGGQILDLRTVSGAYNEVFLSLHGEHQADNAAVAVAAVEALLVGDEALDTALVDALGSATSPGRLEAVRRDPTVLLDAAHNPAGAAALAAALRESFTFLDTTLVVAVMADKDIPGILEPLRDVADRVIVTRNSQPRSASPQVVADIAAGLWGEGAVTVEPDLAAALAAALQVAEQSGGGVVVTGSVMTVADARALLVSADPGGADPYAPDDEEAEDVDPDYPQYPDDQEPELP